MSVSRRELFDVWREEKTLKEKNFAVFSYISTKINVSEDEDITQQINNFNSKLNHKWKCCKGTLKQFVKKEFGWLNTNIDFNVKPEIDDTAAGPSGISSGRPQKISTFCHSQQKSEEFYHSCKNIQQKKYCWQLK